jgi:hypothetical protein
MEIACTCMINSLYLKITLKEKIIFILAKYFVGFAVFFKNREMALRSKGNNKNSVFIYLLKAVFL